MEKKNKRPLPPFRFPEADLETLKKIYKSDEHDGQKGFRSIIHKAYVLYRRESHLDELPERFSGVMKLDEKELPQHFTLALVTKINEVWDDTIHAQATLDFADGKEPKEEPTLLYTFSFEREGGKEPESMSDKAMLNAKNTDFFTKPEKTFSEWEKQAKTSEERRQIKQLRKELTYMAFRRIVQFVAKETGEDELELIDPERRTPEQEKKLLEGIRAAIAQNKENIYNSMLTRVIRLLYEKSEPSKLRRDSARTVINFAVGYFFAKHPELDYKADEELQAEQVQEALEIYARMIDAVEKRDKNERVLSAIRAFIEADTPHEEEREIILQCVEETVDETLKYRPILQNKATNALAHTTSKRLKGGQYDTVGRAKVDDVEIILDDFTNLSLSVPTTKVLDACVLELTKELPHGQQGEKTVEDCREVTLSVEDYMDLCGTRDRKETRRQLNESIRALFDVSVKYTERRYVKGKNGKSKLEETEWNARIFDATAFDKLKPAVQNGYVKVKFSYDIAKFLLNAQIMPYPMGLFRINLSNNRHAWHLGRKLAEHHNMNYRKTNSNTISVKKLLEACPELPSYEDLRKGAGQVKKRLMDPFKRDMDELKRLGVLTDWRYCQKGDAALTKKQTEKPEYKEWIEWNVAFEMEDYPRREIKELKKVTKKTEPKTTKKLSTSTDSILFKSTFSPFSSTPNMLKLKCSDSPVMFPDNPMWFIYSTRICFPDSGHFPKSLFPKNTLNPMLTDVFIM